VTASLIVYSTVGLLFVGSAGFQCESFDYLKSKRGAAAFQPSLTPQGSHTTYHRQLSLTGPEEAERESELMDAGADDYIRKPVDAARLLSRVRAALRRAVTDAKATA
jgi:response regulator RpfG family c-di-GMP phosphodiesterase